MKVINKKHYYQVKDVIEELKSYPPDSILFAIYHNTELQFRKRPIYETAETSEAKEVYLYLGNSE